MKKKKYSGSPVSKSFYAEGGIHINPEHEGDFTAFAQSIGMGVQEAAAHVLANRDQYSPERVQQANFARNAAGWRKQMGGLYETPSFIASGLAARKVPCLECGGPLRRADAGGSIVDYLGRQNVDASFANRKKLYNQYFDGAYKGTADQNSHLLELLQTQDAQPPAPEPAAPPPVMTPAPVGPAGGAAAPSYTPFFQTEEDRDAYEKRLGDVANRALWWGDDSDYLRYTSYHPKADGNDCINGVCGLNLKAGLHYSHPTDEDRYLGNTKFTESLQKGMEDYYQTYQPRVGAHLQKLDENGKPFHSMLVYKIDKDEKGKPTKYHVIHNGGDTKFVEKEFTPEDMQEELHPTDRKNPYMIAWNPGLSLDRTKLERERKGKAPFPYNQSEEEVRRYFGETSLPTNFSLREGQGPDPNSPLYYLSGKDVQDQTRNELLGYFNDKDLDRQLRERLRIDDVTLQNLKPYIFGIMGVESNDQNISAARDVKERAARLLKSDPSLGPFQIRLSSVGDRARKAFDIYEQDDLDKDLRKGYIAAVDRMLEAKRVMDDRVAKGYHPELAKADPYARATYYYNQPQRALMSDEDYAKKNFVYQPFTIPNPVGKDWRFSTAVNASQDEMKSAYEKFLEESRLRGDRGSYMHKVQQAAYPLIMEVLDDEEPQFGIANAQLPAVEVVGKRKPKMATKAKGGMVSTEGYKANSPDRFNPYNIIPSNRITMQNVPHPVMGVDNLGNQQLMFPGANYVFPGQAVLEVPLGGVYSRESGVESRGALSQRLRTAQQGGVAMVIPPYTLDMRLHEPKTKDSMLPADSPVFQKKQAVDAALKNQEVLSRTPAQQAAYEKQYYARQIAEEDRQEQKRQRELDRRAKVIEQSDAIQDNTSFFSPERWSRQNLAAISQATPERFRLFPESVGGAGEFVDNYLNPFVWVGNLAKGLGEAPLQAQQTNSVAPYFKAVGTPLVAGAIGINPVTSITNPVKGVFTSKGLTGQVENLWENVIKSNAVDNLKDQAIGAAKETLSPVEEVTPGGGYRYGGRYPQNTYMQQGGPVDETQRQKDWFLSYVNSQNYLDKLKMQGFSNPEAERDARLQNLQKLPPVKYSRDLGWNQGAYMPREYKGMMYKQGWVPAAPDPSPIFGIETPGTMYLAPQYAPGKTPEARFSTTPAHEYSHVTNDGGFRIPDKTIEKIYRYTLRNSAPERFEKVFAPAAKDVPDQTQYRIQLTDPDPQSPVWGTKQGTSFVLNAPEAGEIQIPYRGRFVTRKFGPVNDPSEFQARLDAALYKANELGIYDARTQRLDKETFRRILNDPRMRENSDFQEFYGMLQGDDAQKEEEVMDLTNTTASRSNGNGSTVARYGGRVSRKSYGAGKYQEGGQPRRVDVIDKGYQPLGKKDGKDLFYKDVAVEVPMGTGTGNGGPAYDEYLKQQLASGVSPDELVRKKRMSKDMIPYFSQFFVPKRDIVYTDAPAPTPPPANRPATSFMGSELYYPNQHLAALYDFVIPNNANDSSLSNPSKRVARVMMVDKMGRPIPSQYYEIPASEFSNKFTNGVKTLKDTTGIGQYLTTPPMQLGGTADDTGLYPSGMINPFDVDPFSLTNSIGSTPAPAAPASPAAPAPGLNDTGLYPYGVINPFDTDPYRPQTDGSTPQANGSTVGNAPARTRPTGSPFQLQPIPGYNPVVAGPAAQAPKVAPDTRSATVLAAGQPKPQTQRVPDVGAASALIRNMAMLNTALESGNRNRYKQQERIRNLGDNKGPLLPADWEERKGDYDVNNGGFRFNRMIQPQFGVAQMGGFLSEAKQNVPVMPAPPMPVLPSFASEGSMQLPPPSTVRESAPMPIEGQTDFRETGKDIATRTNNPGNIKWHSGLEQFGGYNSGIKGTDGGTFAGFPSIEAGLTAYQSQLFGDVDGIRKSRYYKANTPVDKALRTWSNDGYGAEIYPEIRNKTLGELTPEERVELMKRQFKKESGSMFRMLKEANVFKAGGEYVVTPEQLHMILANGGEVEYL